MGRLMEKAKRLVTGTKPANRGAAYKESDPRTQALLATLKSYAEEKKKKRGSGRRLKRNPRNTGTLGRFGRSGR